MAILQYNLFATDGFVRLPTNGLPCPDTTYSDPIYIWGFVGGLFSVDGRVVNPQFADTAPKRAAFAGTAQLPSPRIDADQGDHVYILLVNLGMVLAPVPPDPHTIHLHGMHVPTQLDGFPETSFAVPVGDKVIYYFLAERPGTYMYHCHVEASQHVQMGMSGALVIYPSVSSLRVAGVQIPPCATNRNFAFNDPSTFFDKDHVMLLTDLDSVWHQAVFTNDPTFNPVNFRPDWWLVNGRAFPDTLKAHPLPGYDSYPRIKVGQKLLLRLINLGYQVAPWHIHGFSFHIIGKDSHPRLLGEHGFTQTIGSGETWDLLLHILDRRSPYANYIFNGQDGYPSLMSQVRPEWWANVPIQGFACPPNPALWNYGQFPTQFFPQFFPMHNHDDYKVTNNGLYPGGQLTFFQVDAP